MNTPDHRLVKLGRREIGIGVWNGDSASRFPPLVVCNGIGMNMEVITPLAAMLGNRTIIAFDPPGVGRSADPWLPYTAGMVANWIAGMLDELEIPEADLFGFSWGGAIAQQFAIQHKRRVRRLALAAIGPGWPVIPGQASILSYLTDPAWIGQLRENPRRAAFIGIGEADRKALTPDFLARLTLPGARGYFFQMAALAGWTSALALPFLDRPVMVVAGSEDQVVPAANSRMLAAIVPGARLEIIDHAGHLLMFSHAEQVAALLRSFLGSDKQGERHAA